MSLVLKSANSNRLEGDWSDDDYDVTHAGKTVGRIFLKTTPKEWLWTIDWFHRKGDKSKGKQGLADTREAAMTAFREAWDRNSVGRS